MSQNRAIRFRSKVYIEVFVESQTALLRVHIHLHSNTIPLINIWYPSSLSTGAQPFFGACQGRPDSTSLALVYIQAKHRQYIWRSETEMRRVQARPLQCEFTNLQCPWVPRFAMSSQNKLCSRILQSDSHYKNSLYADIATRSSATEMAIYIGVFPPKLLSQSYQERAPWPSCACVPMGDVNLSSCLSDNLASLHSA